jgi:hypothetical protein
MTNLSTAPLTPERILQLAWGFAPPLILEAAIRHCVFDVLDVDLEAEMGPSGLGSKPYSIGKEADQGEASSSGIAVWRTAKLA